MITIEKFVFDSEDLDLIGSQHGNDYTIGVVADDVDPIHIDLTVRGAENFRNVIQQIYNIGMGLLLDVPGDPGGES